MQRVECRTMKMHSHKEISDMLLPALNVYTFYAVNALANKCFQKCVIDVRH